MPTQEDYKETQNRKQTEREQFTAKAKPLNSLSRDIMRRGYKELIALISAFLEPLKATDSVKASSAFEALMRKSHSLQAGIEASKKLLKENYSSSHFECLSWQMQFALDNVVQSLYMVGSAMRENQNTVIGKPQIDDKDQVRTVVELMNNMSALLEHALEADGHEWERNS